MSDTLDRDDADREIVLTEAQHEYVKGWIAGVRGSLALGGWHLELSRRASKPDTTAGTFVRDEMDFATIYLSRAWLDSDADNRRKTLIHELLHPTVHRVTGLAYKLIEGEVGNTAERFFVEAVRLAEEQMVERLALALAPLFPPIELASEIDIGASAGSET